MQAYTKSALPCYGILKPARTEICRRVFDEHPLDGFASWRDTVLALWRDAGYREERYAAIDLTGERRYRGHQTPAAVPLYEELIVTGAWWDLVDEAATRRIGPLLRAFPAELRPVVLEWSADPDRWKRRTAIICQIGARTGTDVDLLAACIAPSLTDRDFFLRKGIGWALREHAKTDPDWVRRFVRLNAGKLSPLSTREALRTIGPR
jgi:3-methyladenine DNA glycosylase AlkD